MAKRRIVDDLNEALRLLKEAGWEAMVPDTPVPYFDNGVPAGNPRNMGEADRDYVLLPRELVGYEPIIMIPVRGQSMEGAGIEDGDTVILCLTKNIEDGDVVVAWLDGEATLKVFYRDEDGEAWLVPQNDLYQPIRVSDFSSAEILGKVVDVKKPMHRVPFRAIQQMMRKVKRTEGSMQEPSDERLRRAVGRIAKQLPTSRHWFCIYRVMVDKGLLPEGDFYGLRDKMDLLFPDNDFSINPKDLQRLDVDCFHKRLIFWEEHDAPVQGKRFYEYLTVANTFKDYLA